MTRRPDDPPALTRLGSAHVPVKEASGLAWDPATRRLLVVGDEASRVYEIAIDRDGLPTFERKFKLHGDGAEDLEGIALSADGEEIWVTLEGQRCIRIHDREGAAKRYGMIEVENAGGGDGLEGIAIAPDGRVFVVHEKNPRRLLEIDRDTLEIVRETRVRDLKDLSGICCHGGALWIVSDESAGVLRLDEAEDGEWNVGGCWSIDAPNAEGIEIVDDRIYIAFDTKGDAPNLAWYALPR